MRKLRRNYEKITKKKKNYEKENRDTFVFLDGFHD